MIVCRQSCDCAPHDELTIKIAPTNAHLNNNDDGDNNNNDDNIGIIVIGINFAF